MLNITFLRIAVVGSLLIGLHPFSATAQDSSLLRKDLPTRRQQPITLDSISWTVTPPTPRKEIQLHDIISIRVDVASKTSSDGEVERRKTTSYNAALLDWIRFDRLSSVKPAAQADGDPTIQGEFQQLYRADGEIENSESMTFNIAAEIVDIRRNGTLVLEARRRVRSNNEVWEYSLTGLCSKSVVGPGSIVLSRDIAQLEIHKRERGHVRDGYRRGWLQRFLDLTNPF